MLNYCVILLLALISVTLESGGRIKDLEDEIPFFSTLSPPFPLIIQKSKESREIHPRWLRSFSVHILTITFKRCSKLYRWSSREFISIEASKLNSRYISAVFSRERTPYSGSRGICSLKYLTNVPYNLDGFPLIVTYALRGRKAVEQSYRIKYLLSDLHIVFDKRVYHHGDLLAVRCIVTLPLPFTKDNIILIPPENSFIENSRRMISKGFILEVTGNIYCNQNQNKLFLCRFQTLSVNKSIKVKTLNYNEVDIIEQTYNISYVALALCLTLFLIILIILGGYTLVIGRKERLSFDISAFYTELLEDRTIRFANPIINNLTSPLRKYKLPGMLTAYQLRKNFKRLMALLLSNFAKETPKLEEIDITKLDNDEDIPDEEVIEKKSTIEDVFMGILPGRTAVSLGPYPQKMPKYVDFKSQQQLEEDEEEVEAVEEARRLAARESINTDSIDSDVSLDRHVISTLPYTRLLGQKDPHWLVQESQIPVKTGISPHARIFQSKSKETN